MLLAVATAPGVLAPGIAAAIDDSDAAVAPALEEIDVTATRREQELQTVPVAVTALTVEQLERRQVVDEGAQPP